MGDNKCLIRRQKKDIIGRIGRHKVVTWETIERPIEHQWETKEVDLGDALLVI